MLFNLLVILSLSAGGAYAAVNPYLHARGSVTNPTFTDGFQSLSPNPTQLQVIEQEANGTLSNGTSPKTLPGEAITALQLIALNERFESIFFQQLYHNVSTNVSGFEIPNNVPRQYMLDFLNTVQKTEELHTLDAEDALQAVKATTIQPCTSYNFPVSNLTDSLLLAATFTSNVFGVLGSAATTFASTGAVSLVDHIIQIVAAEAEQAGFFRYLLGRSPQELPFTTPSSQAFAFTALHSFIDASSCPNINAINLTLYDTMNVITTPEPKDMWIEYQLDTSKHQWDESTPYYAVYNNQLNTPVVEQAIGEYASGDTVTVKAWFPYTEHQLNGLTVVAITNSSGPFTDIDDVESKAIWAPGLLYPN